MIDEVLRLHWRARIYNQDVDDSHSSGVGIRRPVQVARECTYPDFLKCQPLNFKGTEGVVGLTRWFEKMERASLHGGDAHVRPLLPEAAHAMPMGNIEEKDDLINTAEGRDQE
ncbi:hypothetical protein Tco_1212488 [Tanacetum coccineum]